MSEYGFGRDGAQPLRGPYGTNEGDKWLAPGSEVQAGLDRHSKGMILVHEIIDGEEAIYVTEDPELLAEAEEGHRHWVAAQAVRN